MRSDGPRAPLTLKLAAAAGLLFLHLPLLLIVLYAFTTEDKSYEFPPPGYTTRWFAVAWGRQDIWDALWLSARVAAIATLLALVLGTLAAAAVSRSRFFGRETVSLLLILPIALPGIIATSIFAFTGAWNDFLGPWIMLMSEQGRWPLSVVLYKLQYFLTGWQPSQGSMDPAVQQLVSSGVGYNALMALSVVESIPMFVAFLIFREQLMRGIQISNLKG